MKDSVSKRLLICDLDNTLYDWVSYFVPTFYAMADEVVRITNCDRDRLLDDFRLILEEDNWIKLSFYAAKQNLILEDRKTANLLLDKTIEVLKTSKDGALQKRKLLAEGLFLRENYQEAETVLEEVLQLDPKSIFFTTLLAIAYAKNEKQGKAQAKINALEMLRADYQYGAVDYALAQYYAAIADEEQTINNLLKSVAAGNWYAPESFQEDVHQLH